MLFLVKGTHSALEMSFVREQNRLRKRCVSYVYPLQHEPDIISCFFCLFSQKMASYYCTFLAASIISLLVSHVVARSLPGESLAEPELLTDDADAEMSYRDPDSRVTLLDILDFLMAYRHLTPADQSDAAYRMGGGKRSWRMSTRGVPKTLKRKMFWSPLGHLPASARLGGRPQAVGPKMNSVSSPVFRYG